MLEDKTSFIKRSAALPFVEMRRANRSSVCYQTHSHDEFSFGVVDAGDAYYHTQKHKDHIVAKTTVLINPGDAHSCNPKAGRWSYRMLFVDSRWVGKRQQEILAAQGQDYFPFPRRYEYNFRTFCSFDALFQCLFTETNVLVAESKLLRFIELRYLAGYARHKEAGQLIPQGVQRVKEVIMDRLGKNVTLDELVKHAELSRYHLIRSFKQAYGQSPHAYQLDQRINKAKSLLQKGKSIVDTSGSLGFADQSHFQRNFKKRLGSRQNSTNHSLSKKFTKEWVF